MLDGQIHPELPKPPNDHNMDTLGEMKAALEYGSRTAYNVEGRCIMCMSAIRGSCG